MIIEFDEDTVNNLTADEVRKWYTEHHTEEDLAYVHNLVHEMWVYHEDATYDYEEDTPEYTKFRSRLFSTTIPKSILYVFNARGSNTITRAKLLPNLSYALSTEFTKCISTNEQ